MTFEVLRHERDQFLVGFAIDWRRLNLGEPHSIFLLLKQTGAGIGFDLYLDDSWLHKFISEFYCNLSISQLAVRLMLKGVEILLSRQ
jgi:hypothetical protein